MDIDIQNLENELIETLNRYSALPLGVKRLVMQNIVFLIEKEIDKSNKVLMEQNKESKNEQDLYESSLGEQTE